jgi:hypothetical protein
MNDERDNFTKGDALYYLAVFVIGSALASCAPEGLMDFVMGGRW